MTNKNILAGLFFLIFIVSGNSQNILDAYRYSFQTPTGSARFNGLGGAMSAIGADLSVASHNPAGIGAFWKSEVAGTMNVSVISNNATLINGGLGKMGTSDFEMTIPQGGIVFTTYTPNKNWMAKSFSITYNKMADFDSEIFYEGNSLGSISERWAALGTGVHPDDLGFLEAGPAYSAGVIYDREGDGLYEYDYFRHEDQKLYRSQLIDREGGWGEAGVTFSGNYRNKLLIGATVGLDFINYQSKNSYLEEDKEDVVPQFNELRFTEYLTTSGVGFNAKIGAIVKFTPAISWSASLATPTVLSLTENFRNTIQYKWTENNSVKSADSDSGESRFEYQFINPWRVSTGLAYKIGRSGFINGELDYVGYNFAKFNFKGANISDQQLENDLNRQIDNEFSSSLNFRVGGEYVLGAFRLRGGVFMFGSPLDQYKNTKGFSLGFGYRADRWYLDLAYMNRYNSYDYRPYELNNAVVPSVDINSKAANIGLTIGFKI